MAVTWTTVRDSLTAAAPAALGNDKGAALSLRDRIAALGARYDAAVAAGTFAPSSAGTGVGVASSQRFTAWDAALRAVQRMESFIPGAQQVWAPTDGFDYSGASVQPTTAVLCVGRDGTVSERYTGFGIRAAFNGAAGNAVSVRFRKAGDGVERATVEGYLGARLVESVGFSRDGVNQWSASARGRLFVTDQTTSLPNASMASAVALRGGVGDDPNALAYRATTSRARANGVILGPSTDPTTRAAASTTAARVEALVNDLQRAFNGTAPASNAAPATEPTDLERQLAAALDEGRALLTYLGA